MPSFIDSERVSQSCAATGRVPFVLLVPSEVLSRKTAPVSEEGPRLNWSTRRRTFLLVFFGKLLQYPQHSLDVLGNTLTAPLRLGDRLLDPLLQFSFSASDSSGIFRIRAIIQLNDPAILSISSSASCWSA